MDEQLRQRLNRKLLTASLSVNPNNSVNSNFVNSNSVNLSGEAENTFVDEHINNETVKYKNVNDEYVDKYVDDKYFSLQEEPGFSIIENIVSDPTKLALVFLFGVSMYALYALSKK